MLVHSRYYPEQAERPLPDAWGQGEVSSEGEQGCLWGSGGRSGEGELLLLRLLPRGLNIKDRLQPREPLGSSGSADSLGRRAGPSLEAAQRAGAKSGNSPLTGRCWLPFNLFMDRDSGDGHCRICGEVQEAPGGLMCWAFP